jgi:hypothetical protein
MERKNFFNKNNVYGKNENLIVIISSIILSCVTLSSFVFTEIKNKNLLTSNMTIAETNLCKILKNEFVMDVYKVPFAFLLLAIFVILHKRRSFCINNCSWKNIGLPMTTSLWKKSDRMYSSLVYCIISFQVFKIIENKIVDSSKPFGLERDYFGLLYLIELLLRVFLIGIRK